MARLTPRDIQEKEFSSGFRGYKEEEVDEFLDRITSSYEEVFKENIDVKEEVERLTEENKKYELIGERMQAALVAAQETADDVRKNATKEAENILREAEIKAHKMVQESRDQHRELQKSLAIVKQIEEEYRFKLKSTLQSYLKLLDEVAIGENKDVKRWILPEDMAALGERRREMEERESPAKKPVEAPPSADDTAGKQKAEAQKEAAKEEPVAKTDEKKPAAAEAPADKSEDTAPAPKAKAEEAPPAKKEEAPASAEDTAGKQKAEEEKPAAVKVEASAKPVEVKVEAPPVKKEEAAPAKEDIIEDSKVKTAALLDEIAAQAAEEKKAEEVKEAQKQIAQKTEEKKAETKAETTQPPAKSAGDTGSVKTEEKKSEAKTEEAKAPFDQDAGQASAVSAEWNKLQEAVDEAVKATEKPTKAEREAKAADSTMPGEMMEAKPAKVEAAPEPVKPVETEPKAKAESKEAKTGKSALEDIEIVEDESFWKDI